MLYDVKNGQASNVFRVKLRNSSVTTGAGLTGLTSSSTGLIVSTICDNEATATTYTVAASHVQTITTLGTFAAPTALNCRFKEVDATNHPGLYEVQIADARFAVASAKVLTVSFSGATNLAECDVVIPLRVVDPYSAAFGLTLAKTTNITGFNDIAAPTGFAAATFPGGTIANTTNITAGTLTTVTTATTATNLTNLPSIPANWITAAGITAAALNGKGDWMASYTQPTGFLAATFPGGTVANTTNITAGTITTTTTATNLTNLPSIPANWLTAAGINAGALNGKGDWLLSSSYTAAPTAAANATAIWQDTTAGDFTTATSPGKILFTQLGGAFTTTSSSILSVAALANAPSGTGASAASIATAVWQDLMAGSDFSTAGSVGALVKADLDTNIGSRMATYSQPSGFLAATFPATVASTTNITAGTIATVTTLTNLPAVPTDWLTAAGVKADAVTKIQAGLATPTNITAGTITTTTNLTTNNDKTGYSLATAPPTAAAVATTVWQDLTASSDFTTVGSAGALVLANLNAAVGSRMATYAQPSGFLAATFPGAVASPTNITAGTITTVTTLTNLPAAPTDWVSALAVSAAAVTKIQAGLSTYAGGDTAGTATLLTRLTSGRATGLDFLDIAVSSRSTYAGGAVASVTAPVTVGTNSDKTGYALSAAGLDAVPVESGVNARQAFSPVLAACVGLLSGAGTGTIVVKAGHDNATTRITATTDGAGNRSAVTLVIPT